MTEPYQVGLLIPLEEEFRYISELCSIVRTVTISGEPYIEARLPSGRLLICKLIGEAGIATATLAAERMHDAFGPLPLAVVGIAGALDSDLRLGDVIVASEVDYYQYNIKARGARKEYEFQHAGKVFQTTYEIASRARNFAVMPEVAELKASWETGSAARLPNAHIDVTINLSRLIPRFFVGPVASGDILGATEQFTSWLHEGNRQLLALEMEGAGAALAAYARKDPLKLLVIRGVSDFADERKRDLDKAKQVPGAAEGVWRKYATQNAFAFLLTLLEYGIFEQEVVRPKV